MEFLEGVIEKQVSSFQDHQKITSKNPRSTSYTMKITDPHAGPGVQTSALVVSKLVPRLDSACGVFLCGPELRLMFVFLKGLTTTTKTQQRTICGLQSQPAPPGSLQEASADQHHTGVSSAQCNCKPRPRASASEHLSWERDLLVLCSRFFSSQLFFSSISSKLILISLHLVLGRFQLSIN